MPLPGDLNTITVTGTFKTVAGAVASGTVTFIPSTIPLIDSVGHVLIDATTVATLNGSGQISVAVACTDNTNLPAFTYTIQVVLNGAGASMSGAKTLPHTLGSTVDLSSVLP